MTWSRAIHIQQWADTLPAQGDLPALVRRLIRNTVPRDAAVNFPAHEQTHRPGFDGVVSVSKGNQYVPAGDSVWEMGVDRKMLNKANADFAKRTKATPESDQKNITYVAVTPREWQKKDAWAAKKATESKWKKVIALDCNDLEQWLGLSIGTDLWFSVLLGRPPVGVVSIAQRWPSLSGIANVPLTTDVFLVARERQEQEVIDWLSGDASSAFLQARSFDIGLDFVTAFVAKHSGKTAEGGEFILVSDSNAWHNLAVSRDSFVLVPSDELALNSSDIAEAIQGGHHVLVCNGQTSAIRPGKTIELPELDNYKLADVLTSCGFPEAKARTDARACCGSTTVLKRLITDKPMTVFPEWSSTEHAVQLAPYALFGAWVHVDRVVRPTQLLPDTTPIDVFFLQEFLGRSRQSIDDCIARWSTGPDALFRRFGTHVVISSREDAWYLLGGYLSREHVKQFEDVACLILEEDDPAYDLDQEQRWMANIYGKVFSLSGELRAAIVESMTLMVTIRTAISPPSDVDFAATCRRILERVLPVRASWKRWASLGQNLILLAECQPDLFLSRVEQDLSSAEPELPKLFQDKGHTVFTRAEHTSLLWALETASWNPEYLARALAALCRLGDSDPGGTYGNRPDVSAKQVLLLNHSATADQRVAAIQNMVEGAPTTAWKVIAAILSSGYGGMYTMPHLPRWRPWANQYVAADDYGEKVYNAVTTMLQNAPERWASVLDGLLRMHGRRTCDSLESATENVDPESNGMFELWNTIRETTDRHRRYAGRSRTFSSSILERLESVRDHLVPTDPVRRHHWLFARHVVVPDIPEEDFDRQRVGIRERQIAVLREIVHEGGYEGIQRLYRTCEWPQDIGYIVGNHNLLAWSDIGVPEVFDHDNEFVLLASSYASARFYKEQWESIRGLDTSSWVPQQVVNLALSLPFRRDVWDWVERLSEDVAALYWDKVNCGYARVTESDLSYAVDKLLARDRPFTAIALVDVRREKDRAIDAQLAADLLFAGLHSAEQPDQHQVYSVERFIGALQEKTDFPVDKMALIEWGYLPLFDRHASPLTPKGLERAVYEEPEFFVMLLEAMYIDENGPREPLVTSELDRAKAERARMLLENLTRVPGVEADGSVNYGAMAAWISAVRPLAKAKGRSVMADFEMGKLLYLAPKDDKNELTKGTADILETLQSDSLINGYGNALRNRRGVTSRSPFDGGKQEHELAQRYSEVSRRFASTHPAVSRLFAGISADYTADARREDLEAERERLGR